MGKVLKAVAMVGLAVGIAVLAAPTGGLSLGLAGFLSISTVAASAIVAAGLGLVANMALQAIAGRPSTQGPAASPSTFRQSITNARIIYGKRRAGGVICFFHPRKVGKTHYRYFVVAIAGHRCRGVVSFILNDEIVTVDGAGKVTAGAYANAAWLWFERGDENAAANDTFVAECAPQWTAAHRGRGIAKVYAKFEMTDAVVSAGMPNITIEVEGKDDVRDPRTGTRGYTRNAIAVFYDWLSLPRPEGGFGAYADELPDDDWLSANANVCDEAVPLRAGGTEERYAFDSVIEIGSPPSEVRQTFVTCCAGTYAYSGGRHLMRPGYWVPVSVELEEDDLSGAFSLPVLADEGEIASEVTGTFIDPSTLYQAQPVPTRSLPSVDVRQGDYDLPHITSHPRGQRILEIMLRRANAELRVTWPMNIVGIAVAAMDTVRINTSRYRLSNYAWTTTSWGLSTDFGVVLGLKEESPDLYEWNAGMELLPGEVPELARAETISDQPARASFTLRAQTDMEGDPFPYPVTSDDTSITVAAFNGTLDDGRIISFPAGTMTGLVSGTAYVVFYDLDGGSYSAVREPATTETASSRYVQIRFYSTSDGGVYPSSPTAPGGDGGGGGGGRGVNNVVLD